MIDNINKIIGLLDFESKDDFYYLQILQRKKENPQLGSNSRVIKNYYITSKEYLITHYDEIKTLCNIFNARASIRLNRRSFRQVAYKNMVKIANTMNNEDYKSIRNSFDRACGLLHNDKNKTWIVDIDLEDFKNTKELECYINKLEPIGNKVICKIPSKTGIHLITKPFRLDCFKQKYPLIDIHKDNPTNLFIP